MNRLLIIFLLLSFPVLAQVPNKQIITNQTNGVQNYSAPASTIRGSVFAQPGYIDITGLGSAANNNVVPTNIALMATSSVQSPVVRTGYYTIGDSPAVTYIASGSSCSLYVGAGDGGSQIPTSDGKCWIATLPKPTPVEIWGAGSTKTGTFNAAAINACLSSVGANGICLATGRYSIASNINIPTATALQCGWSNQDSAADATLNTRPALVLAPGTATIQAAGPGTDFGYCLVENGNLTFPVSGYMGFAGIAITDAGNSGMNVHDSAIFGFDTAVYSYGNRPHWHNLIADGTGITKAVYEWDVGNTDSGSMSDIQGASGYDSQGGCTKGLRPGTGLRIGGATPGAAGVFISGRNVMEGYNTYDYDFQNSAIAQALWADNFNWVGTGGWNCGFGSEVGVNVGAGVYLQVNQMTSAQSNTAIRLGAGSYLYAGEVYTELTGAGGSLVVGTTTSGATVHIGHFEAVGAQGKGIVFNNVNTLFHIDNANFSDINAGVGTGGTTPSTGNAPYIYNNSGSGTLVIGKGQNSEVSFGVINQDLGRVNIYGFLGGGNIAFGHEVAGEVAFIPPTSVSCTGLGSTGSCSLSSNYYSNVIDGVVAMVPGGTGTGSNGSITINEPYGAESGLYCTGSNNSGSGAVPVTTTANILYWNATSALTNGATYYIYYHCVFL